MPPTPRSFEVRFWPKVKKTATCWIWTAGRTSRGYGSLQGRLAHRAAYEFLVGPIPAGMTVDHLCRVRHCINPAHMEIVERGENVLRGHGITAMNKRKTRCLHGHLFTPTNTYHRPDNPHYRACRR